MISELEERRLEENGEKRYEKTNRGTMCNDLQSNPGKRR
jgi:hypothetical protein